MKLNELLLVAQKKEKECLSLLLRDSLVDMAYCSIGHMLVCPGREALQKTKNAIVQQAVQHYYPRWVCVHGPWLNLQAVQHYYPYRLGAKVAMICSCDVILGNALFSFLALLLEIDFG